MAILLLMATICLGVGIFWNELFEQNLADINSFLISIWVAMTALLCWRVQPARDGALILISLVGGSVFEWWGTSAQLWYYFTGERPPIWILPAWPVAALAAVRVAALVEWIFARQKVNWRILYWILTITFTVGMIRFLWPAIGLFTSKVAVGLMIVVMASSKSPKEDVCSFAAGSFLGFFLEYWGTSRSCWTYYTQEIPPPITVVAHGFAPMEYCEQSEPRDEANNRIGYFHKELIYSLSVK